jgi:hypothetical protein
VRKPTDASAASEARRAAQVDPATASPLERLRTGAIDLNGYLDMKVDAATAHLQGLSPKEMGAVKKMLRDQIASDPALSDLVKQATGSAPTPAPED